MSKLLYIQASPRPKRSKSIAAADAFAEAYKQNNPDDRIVTLNIFDTPIPAFDGPAVQAKYSILHGRSHSKQELNAWKAIEAEIARFKSADKYLLAVPMWNFGIPYRLKQYIDVLVQPSYKFSFSNETGYQGLVTGKPLLAVYARGGEYTAGTEVQAFDLQTKYIELVFTFMGFTDIRSIVIEPTLQGVPDVTQIKLSEAINRAKQLAADF